MSEFLWCHRHIQREFFFSAMLAQSVFQECKYGEWTSDKVPICKTRAWKYKQ